MATWSSRSTSQFHNNTISNNTIINTSSSSHSAHSNLNSSSSPDDHSLIPTNLSTTSYDFAYHHHLQTALHMGQFYNPEHFAHHHHHHHHHAALSTAALLRSSGGGGSGGSSSTSSSLLSVAAVAAAAAGANSSVNSCLGSSSGGVGGGGMTITGNSLWENPLLTSPQRNNPSSLPFHSSLQSNELINPGPSLPCDLWSNSAPPAIIAPSTSSNVNGRGHSQRSGHKSSSKKPRRRVATIAQRRAANIRERRRMFNLNEAFDKLRRKVPTFAYEKRLSRIETLRLAITYISFMGDLLHSIPPGKSDTPSTDRKSSSSTSSSNIMLPNTSHYGLNGSSNNNSANLNGLGIECHQNQSASAAAVAIPSSSSSSTIPFGPLTSRMYPHHPHHHHHPHSSSAYLHPNLHHHHH